MDLDKLQLSAFTIRTLYTKSIIKLDASNPDPINLSSTDIKFLGGNQSGILIVINNPKNPFLHETDLAFLTKVLSACKLTLADIAIVNLKGLSEVSITDFKNQFKPSRIILFGVSANVLALPFQIPDFQVQNYDQIRYLTLPELSFIEKDQQLKKMLWTSFQKIFDL